MPAKIGLGIITCARPEFFKQAAGSIPYHKLDAFVVVDDSGKVNEIGVSGR